MGATLKYIVEVFRSLLTVTKELEDARKEIKELRETVSKMTRILQAMSDQIGMNDRKLMDALANHKLQVENQFLKSDRLAMAYIKSTESLGDGHDGRAELKE